MQLTSRSHFLTLGILLIAFICFSDLLYAAKGEVVYKSSRCDYFIVETPSGYALLEWYGGNDPDKGDIVVGNYEDYGFKDIYNLTADQEMKVWVEDYWLSKDDALERLFELCE